jgi:hypothetical protein
MQDENAIHKMCLAMPSKIRRLERKMDRALKENEFLFIERLGDLRTEMERMDEYIRRLELANEEQKTINQNLMELIHHSHPSITNESHSFIHHSNYP